MNKRVLCPCAVLFTNCKQEQFASCTVMGYSLRSAKLNRLVMMYGVCQSGRNHADGWSVHAGNLM